MESGQSRFRKNTRASSGVPLLQRLASFTQAGEYDTTYLTHGIHPYPAKYIPQLPREIICAHTNERNTILDPFCGSGTTLLEASILGRKSVGIDSNPIAVLISRAKTQVLNEDELRVARDLKSSLSDRGLYKQVPETRLPSIPRIEHWFQENVLRELGFLKSLIESVEFPRLRDFLLCTFSSIIVSVSNQESDTRYAAKNKAIPGGHVLRRFAAKLGDTILRMEQLGECRNASRNTPVVYNLDCRHVDREIIADDSVDLVVTSPPYPNSYDYYLYHKMRMYWLGYNPAEAREVEIGSRHEHSSRKAPIETFESKMVPAMSNVARTLKPSKLAYFFVGDSIIAGELINMKGVFSRIGAAAGLKLIADSEYSLEKVTRSFHEKRFSSNRNAGKKKQRILVFERIARKSQVLVRNRIMASPTASWKVMKLNGAVPDKAKIAIQSDDTDRHIHSLGRYPSRFIPDIPRWAITQFSKPGDWVLDPFVGAGTTAVEAVLLSRHVVGADISPYSCLLTRAKTLLLTDRTIQAHAKRLLDAIADPRVLQRKQAPRFEYDTFWFNIKHLNEFETVRQYIITKMPLSTQAFFMAALSTVIKPCSFLDESQVKVKRDPRKVLNGTPSPISLLKEKIPGLTARFSSFRQLADENSVVKVLQHPAEALCPQKVKPESIDLVVTSPPYINAMNYPMIHRYENLLLCGLAESARIAHEQKYIGTERVYANDYSRVQQFEGSFPLARQLNPLLRAIYQGEPKRSFVVYQYFRQMHEALENILWTLKPGGRCVLVAGTNVIRGVPIDTFGLIVALLAKLGLRYCSSFHYEIIKNAFKLTRHRTANLIRLDGVCVMEKPE